MTLRASPASSYVALTVVALTLIAAIACSGSGSPAATRTASGRDLRTPTSVHATVTPGSATVIAIKPGAPLLEGPPSARATSGSSSVDLTSGSFVWNGVQGDALHVITSTERLTASPGATIIVANPARLSLASADAGFVPATDQPSIAEAGILEWPYGAFTRAGVASIVGDEVHVIAPQTPGEYVGTLFLKYAAVSDDAVASQVYYHLLVNVE